MSSHPFKISATYQKVLRDVDLTGGELYLVNRDDPDGGQYYEFTSVDPTGRLRFDQLENANDDPTSRELGSCLRIPIDQFRTMRSDGRMVRINPQVRSKKALIDIGDVDPTNLLDPDEPGISLAEQKWRVKKFEILQRCRTKRFYAMRADDAGGISHGTVGAEKFIAANYNDAKQLGFTWKPSGPTLLRAIEQCGEFQSRPLSAFFYDYGAHDKLKRWHPFVLETAWAYIAQFWRSPPPSLTNIRSECFDTINQKIQQLKDNNLPVPDNLRTPSNECFRLWVHLEENWYTWKERYGEKSANARFRGHGFHIQASRSLEWVIFDHTIIDCWALVEDEHGNFILVEKPTLTRAIDVYSRMTLVAVLSYEKPSIWSVCACLQQVLRETFE